MIRQIAREDLLQSIRQNLNTGWEQVDTLSRLPAWRYRELFAAVLFFVDPPYGRGPRCVHLYWYSYGTAPALRGLVLEGDRARREIPAESRPLAVIDEQMKAVESFLEDQARSSVESGGGRSLVREPLYLLVDSGQELTLFYEQQGLAEAMFMPLQRGLYEAQPPVHFHPSFRGNSAFINFTGAPILLYTDKGSGEPVYHIQGTSWMAQKVQGGGRQGMGSSLALVRKDPGPGGWARVGETSPFPNLNETGNPCVVPFEVVDVLPEAYWPLAYFVAPAQLLKGKGEKGETRAVGLTSVDDYRRGGKVHVIAEVTLATASGGQGRDEIWLEEGDGASWRREVLLGESASSFQRGALGMELSRGVPSPAGPGGLPGGDVWTLRFSAAFLRPVARRRIVLVREGSASSGGAEATSVAVFPPQYNGLRWFEGKEKGMLTAAFDAVDDDLYALLPASGAIVANILSRVALAGGDENRFGVPQVLVTFPAHVQVKRWVPVVVDDVQVTGTVFTLSEEIAVVGIQEPYEGLYRNRLVRLER